MMRCHWLSRCPRAVLASIGALLIAMPVANAAEVDPVKLEAAYYYLSVGRSRPARLLIDKAIESYTKEGDLEKLAYAYLVSTDYYRYLASPDFYKILNSVFFPKPLPAEAVYGLQSEHVIAAHALAESTYREVISRAIAEGDHLKASRNYMRMLYLYGRNGESDHMCETLSGVIDQFNLAVAAQPDLTPNSFLLEPNPGVTSTLPKDTVQTAVEKGRAVYKCASGP